MELRLRRKQTKYRIVKKKKIHGGEGDKNQCQI